MNGTTAAPDVYDVVIVGAGISGINTAHHLQSKVPGITYAILEERGAIGGTWNLFSYPGIRSDTDLHTFGFGWRPWMENRAIADGASIARYLREAAAQEGIDRHIRFRHRVLAANWSSTSQHWDLDVEVARADADANEHENENENDNSHPPRRRSLQARFLILGTGYYDHHEALKAHIPGLHENFKGQIVHPQFWPKDLDYADKRIVIIGSGATAVTLLPSLAKKASHVTMLQRTAGYIQAIDNSVGTSWFHRLLPRSWSFRLSRLSFMATPFAIYWFCRTFPERARAMLQGGVAAQLPAHVPLDPHFQPLYRPWDQRLCFTPNGDFFQSLREDGSTVETGRVQTVTEDAVVLESGKRIEADIVVTATGLKMAIGGRIRVSVDGEPVDFAGKMAWRVSMLQDVPNLAFVLGYINASWTLGAEATAQLVCRVLRHMRRNGFGSATPRLPDGGRGIGRTPLWNLRATYVKQAEGRMPTCGDSGPWIGRTNYFLDLWRAKWASVTTGLEFERSPKKDV